MRVSALSQFAKIVCRIFSVKIIVSMFDFSPPDATNDEHVYFCVMQGNRPLIAEIEESCPEKIISLMVHCWSQKPEARPTFAGRKRLIALKQIQQTFKVAQA